MLREACCEVERGTESGAVTSMCRTEISGVMMLELGLGRGVGIEQLDWGSWGKTWHSEKSQYESRQGADSLAVVMVGAQGGGQIGLRELSLLWLRTPSQLCEKDFCMHYLTESPQSHNVYIFTHIL